jgi:hypothetical protein
MDRFLLNHEVVSRIGRCCPLEFRDGIGKTDNTHRRKSLRVFRSFSHGFSFLIGGRANYESSKVVTN